MIGAILPTTNYKLSARSRPTGFTQANAAIESELKAGRLIEVNHGT
jgi:hypothetical protein